MGPGPPKKKGDKTESKNASQRALNTAGQGSSYASSGAMSTTEAGSSPTAVTEGSRLSGEGWNMKRYQREDEALWGHDTHGPGQRIIDAIAKAGSTAGRLIESRLSRSGPVEEENPGTYYLARNPPVNDLHPPVVSTQPANRDETRWMLQPPPPAKVMEGKERVNRNRAGSNGSSRKGGEETSLSRQVTGRLVDAKLQRGETMPSRDSGSKAPSSSRPQGQRHERSRSQSLESSTSSEGGIRRKRKPPRLAISTNGKSSRGTTVHEPNQSKSTEMGERSARPLLTTIISSSNVLPTVSSGKRGNGHLALQELHPSSNSAVNSRAPSPSNPLSRLSPSVNAMPASIPSVDSKFPGASTFKFPSLVTIENVEPSAEEP